jgi:hypothetical protein
MLAPTNGQDSYRGALEIADFDHSGQAGKLVSCGFAHTLLSVAPDQSMPALNTNRRAMLLA